MNQRKAGVILSYLGMGANSLIQIVYVPMLLYYLTKSQYGIYQLMGSLIAYLSIMDFGLANTTVRYLSQSLARKDKAQFDRIINTSYTLYLMITMLLIIIGFIFYVWLTPVYSKTLSPSDLLLAKHIFLIMLFNIAISIPANIFVATINAHERFVFLRGINFVKIILQPLVVWGVLAWKASVLNLVLVQTIVNLCAIGINYFYCKKEFEISVTFQLKDKLLMKELTGFSIFIFLHTLIDQIYWRLGLLILGAVVSTAAVANYSIAIQLSLFVIFVPAGMSGVFLPHLSSIVAKQKDTSLINAIFCKIGRLQFMLIMLMLIGFIFLGKTFITLWLGTGYEICYWVALILMAAYVLDVSQNLGVPMLQAMKKHAFRAYVYVAMAILNIILCIPLAKTYGEIGCAFSTAICLLLGSGVAINWYYWYIGIDIKTFFKNIGKLMCVIIPIVVMLLGLFLCWPVKTTILSFIAHGSVLTIIYSSMLWKFAFNEYEKNLVLQPLARLKTILKIESKFH